jgi:hypothetical protein
MKNPIKWLIHRLGLDHSPSLMMLGTCPCSECGEIRRGVYGTSEPHPGWLTEGFSSGLIAGLRSVSGRENPEGDKEIEAMFTEGEIFPGEDK